MPCRKDSGQEFGGLCLGQRTMQSSGLSCGLFPAESRDLCSEQQVRLQSELRAGLYPDLPADLLAGWSRAAPSVAGLTSSAGAIG